MLRMDISYGQLAEQGMTEHTERLFKLDAEEWQMLGKRTATDTVCDNACI